LLNDRIRLVIVCLFSHYGLVNMRIKMLADSRNRLDAQRFQHSAQLLVNQIDAAKEMPGLVRLGRFYGRLGVERAPEIVKHRQQLRNKISYGAVVGLGTLALNSLAKV